MAYPAAFVELVGDLFVGLVVASTSSGLCNAPPTGTLLARCHAVSAMLIERGTTHQSYHFMNWIHRVPRALEKLGWLLNLAETRAARFMEKHFPSVAVTAIVDVTTRATDHAVLLQVAGTASLAASRPLPAAKAEAAVAVLSVVTLAQRLLGSLFFDDVDAAWLTHGAAGVGTFLEEALSEAPGSVLDREKTAFFAWAWGQTQRLRDSVVGPLLAGAASVRLETWMFTAVSVAAPAAVVARLADDETELARGDDWSLQAANVPPGVGAIVIETAAALPAPPVFA